MLSSVSANANQETHRKRFYYMDALNVVACIAVVVLHCSSSVFLNEGNWFWRYCVAIQSLFIFAVPIFFMISGANLLGYRERYSTIEFFQKRMRRILGVFIGCSVLIYVLQCLPIAAVGGGWRQPSIRDFVQSFFDNSICNIYWYFYAIIGLYLVTPVFSKIANDKRLMEYAIIVCFITSAVIPLITRFSNGYNPFANFTYPYLSSWLLYFLAGYYVNTHLNKRIPLAALLVAIICSILFMFAMTIHTNDVARLTMEASAPYDSFYANAMGLPGAILSISLFVAGKQLDLAIGRSRIYPQIKKLSALSLGIYAIHLPILGIFNYYLGNHVWWSLIIRAIVVYLLTATVVWFFRFATSKLNALIR